MTNTEEKILEMIINVEPDLIIEGHTIKELWNDPEMTDKLWRKIGKVV